MKRLASELPRGMAGSVSASRPASVPEKGRRTGSQDRNAHRIVAEHRSVSSESKLTSVVRIEPRVVPCLCGGHTMNRDDRLGGRAANRATPAPLPPGNEVRMPQTVAVASGAVKDHFDHHSLDVFRPRIAGLGRPQNAGDDQGMAVRARHGPTAARSDRVAGRALRDHHEGHGQLSAGALRGPGGGRPAGRVVPRAACAADPGPQVRPERSIRPARVCRYGLTTPGHVPPREFAEPRRQCRNRRKLVADRVRVCNRLGKTLDHDSPRLGGALTDLPGRNGGASSTASSRSVRPIASSKA